MNKKNTNNCKKCNGEVGLLSTLISSVPFIDKYVYEDFVRFHEEFGNE